MKIYSFSIAFVFVFCCISLYSQSKTDTIIGVDGQAKIFFNDVESWDKGFQDRIGQKATTFSAKDFEGRCYSSEQFFGKILILYFWNVWDWDSCEQQTAAMNRIVQKYPNDVAVISFVRENINLDEFAFLQEHPVHFPIIPNSHEFGMEYHGYERGTPIAFFIDKQGYWRRIGWKAGDFEFWAAELIKK